MVNMKHAIDDKPCTNIVLRILIIIWGVNKITKKLVRPWATSNNELTDFLSWVPDRVELAKNRIH